MIFKFQPWEKLPCNFFQNYKFIWMILHHKLEQGFSLSSDASFKFFFDLKNFIPDETELWWLGPLTKDVMLGSQKHEKI